jgi:hypothetical protein
LYAVRRGVLRLIRALVTSWLDEQSVAEKSRRNVGVVPDFPIRATVSHRWPSKLE